MRLLPRHENHSCPYQGSVNPTESQCVYEGKETKYSCAEDKSQELSLKLRSFIILKKAQISHCHPGTKPDDFQKINKHALQAANSSGKHNPAEGS